MGVAGCRGCDRQCLFFPSFCMAHWWDGKGLWLEWVVAGVGAGSWWVVLAGGGVGSWWVVLAEPVVRFAEYS